MATEYKTWQIGDVKVTRVLEQEAPLPPEATISAADLRLLFSGAISGVSGVSGLILKG